MNDSHSNFKFWLEECSNLFQVAVSTIRGSIAKRERSGGMICMCRVAPTLALPQFTQITASHTIHNHSILRATSIQLSYRTFSTVVSIRLQICTFQVTAPTKHSNQQTKETTPC